MSRPLSIPTLRTGAARPLEQNASGLSLTHADPHGIRTALNAGSPRAILEGLGTLPTPDGGTLADAYAYEAPSSYVPASPAPGAPLMLRWYPGPLFDHHLRVIENLHTYFPIKPEGMDAQLIDLTAAFHDPGKSKSIPELETFATRDAQKKHTLRLLDWWKPLLPLDGAAFNRMRALITTNAMGGLFQKKISVSAAAQEIRQGAFMADMDPLAFLKLVTVFHQADVGAYTLAAGGPKHLDHVFELTADGQFVPDEANGRLTYNAANEKLLAQLEDSLRGFGKRK